MDREGEISSSSSTTAAPNRFRKVVIPAAGLGTRLLPATKEIPKEMLPVAVRKGSSTVLEPTLQVIFEQLYSVGFREFCFVVGRGKRAIEDHFAPDWAFSEKLKDSVQRTELEGFFERLEASRIYFVNQARRKGFGDAVLHSEYFTGEEPFIVHAGDDLVLSRGARHVLDLTKVYSEKNDADGVVLVEHVSDPSSYGVVVCESSNSERVFVVREIEEKPRIPKSNLAVIAIYAFSPNIFRAIRASKPDASGELQLTSAIRMMIEDGKKFYAVKLRESEVRIDIGNPNSYVHALRYGLHDPLAFAHRYNEATDTAPSKAKELVWR